MGSFATTLFEAGSIRTRASVVSDHTEPNPASSPLGMEPKGPGPFDREAPAMRANTWPSGRIRQIDRSVRLCSHNEPNAATIEPGRGTLTSMVESA